MESIRNKQHRQFGFMAYSRNKRENELLQQEIKVLTHHHKRFQSSITDNMRRFKSSLPDLYQTTGTIFCCNYKGQPIPAHHNKDDYDSLFQNRRVPNLTTSPSMLYNSRADKPSRITTSGLNHGIKTNTAGKRQSVSAPGIAETDNKAKRFENAMSRRNEAVQIFMKNVQPNRKRTESAPSLSSSVVTKERSGSKNVHEEIISQRLTDRKEKYKRGKSFSHSIVNSMHDRETDTGANKDNSGKHSPINVLEEIRTGRNSLEISVESADMTSDQKDGRQHSDKPIRVTFKFAESAGKSTKNKKSDEADVSSIDADTDKEESENEENNTGNEAHLMSSLQVWRSYVTNVVGKSDREWQKPKFLLAKQFRTMVKTTLAKKKFIKLRMTSRVMEPVIEIPHIPGPRMPKQLMERYNRMVASGGPASAIIGTVEDLHVPFSPVRIKRDREKMTVKEQQSTKPKRSYGMSADLTSRLENFMKVSDV